MNNFHYAQFGCGLSSPPGFINYDSSATLRLQRNVLIGSVARRMIKPLFPSPIVYGDIVRGLPIRENSLKGIYSSHVLEHLTYSECQIALKNSYCYLQADGIFRTVLPDFNKLISIYLQSKEKGDSEAASKLMRWTFLGYEQRPSGMLDLLKWSLSNSNHYWMWDYESLSAELERTGFKKIYRSAFGQSIDSAFNEAEDSSRFDDALCIEAVK
jgi:hypothetical protein